MATNMTAIDENDLSVAVLQTSQCLIMDEVPEIYQDSGLYRLYNAIYTRLEVRRRRRCGAWPTLSA